MTQLGGPIEVYVAGTLLRILYQSKTLFATTL